jgi:hypothetical protein
MGGALGSIMGNWVGGFLFSKFGNPITCDIFAFMALTMGTIYFLANIYPAFLLKKQPVPEVRRSMLAKNLAGPTTDVSLNRLHPDQGDPDRENAYFPLTQNHLAGKDENRSIKVRKSMGGRPSMKRKTAMEGVIDYFSGAEEGADDSADVHQSRMVK